MSIDERNQEVNEALQSRFEQLNQAIAQHEANLKALMVPQDTCFAYREHEETDESGRETGIHQWYLGMRKWQGTWRLCHGRDYLSYSGREEEIDWRPLSDCSVDDRIDACPHIEKLKEVIVKGKEALVPKLDATIASLIKSLG